MVFSVWANKLNHTSRDLCTQIMLCCGFVPDNLTHILQGWFTGSGAIVRLPQCQRIDPEGYGKMSLLNPQQMMIKSYQNQAQLNHMYILWNILCFHLKQETHFDDCLKDTTGIEGCLNESHFCDLSDSIAVSLNMFLCFGTCMITIKFSTDIKIKKWWILQKNLLGIT